METKNKEWCIHLMDNQGNTISEIEEIYAKNRNEAVKKAKDKYFGYYGLEINKVCQNCLTDNYYKEKVCEQCDKKL